MLASNDWNDALGEYNPPKPCGKLGDGGVLSECKQKHKEKKKRKRKPNQQMIEKFEIQMSIKLYLANGKERDNKPNQSRVSTDR